MKGVLEFDLLIHKKYVCLLSKKHFIQSKLNDNDIIWYVTNIAYQPDFPLQLISHDSGQENVCMVFVHR